ncbi:hypothetical protein [Mesorhizobium sp.]|uniref:hypothetical protein n=1 Tax=Mesorhizobium sp. TaxID=1871066 RepID=UPI000FE7C6CC|nr:hypothetical protein [Mesorhizobium sp.]RWM29428.1 MAG: hypothetical protein EOR74_07045 [Mesorhizobium sp.]
MARFEYSRMTAPELNRVLKELELPGYGFARIFGVRPDTVRKWLRGELDIPPWVFVALSLLYLDGARHEARRVAGLHIKRDNHYPNRGEFPYTKGGDFMEGTDDDE